MQKLIVIGNLGTDAEVRQANGKSFISFKVADTAKFTDNKGNTTESTTWISCAMTGDADTKVLPYLKKGTKVYVEGRPSYRLYSSEKQRCMLAGVDLHVTGIELCGGSSDAVPRRLVDGDGALHNVNKYFWVQDATSTQLFGERGGVYQVDERGYVTQVTEEQQPESNEQQ